MIRAHVLAKPEDCTRCNNPEALFCTPCNICDGGLAICVVCGGAEGSLTSHCAGERLDVAQLDRVYAGETDYKNGKWVEPGSSPWEREIL
jgi:hypothetical protein